MARVPMLAALLVVLAAGPASCSDGGVVGGRCRYEGCAEPAVGDASSDVDPDAGDAPSDQLGGNDALHPDADAGSTDADAGGSDAGGSDAGGSDAGSDADASTTDGADAGDACTPPLVSCAGTCVDLTSDPEHCGACNNACPSGLCQAGKCVGASAGHVVLLCMSFEQSQQGSPQTALLGNAVFLPAQNPVRVLAYDQHSPNAVENKVKQALGWAASAKGRTFALTPASSSAAVLGLLDKQSFDVFLVYDQTAAPPGALGDAGSAWKASLGTFVAEGGVVVVTSGGGGTGEMSALISNAGLLSVTGQPNVTGQILYNQAPSDAVGLNVLSPFLALSRTCTFTTPEKPGPSLAFVVAGAPDGGSPDPVVVHRVQ